MRVLELFFAIFESRTPLRYDQLHALPGYCELEGSAYDMALSRDTDQLTTMGVRVVTGVDRSGRKTWAIDRGSVDSAKERHLSAEEMLLIHMGLQAVLVPEEHLRPLAELSLRASSDGVLPARLPSTSSFVEGAEGIARILDAIRQRIPVSFAYTSQTESDLRTVEPWRVFLRGHAIYLWGFDLDRQGPRLFRLSRIEGEVSLLGEPGDCDHPMPADIDPFADFTISPLLLVSEAANLPFADALTPEDGPAPRGWQRMRGAPASPFDWRHRIVGSATHCVVVEPLSFQQEVHALLSHSAGGCDA